MKYIGETFNVFKLLVWLVWFYDISTIFRLFNAKSFFIQINSSVSNNSV